MASKSRAKAKRKSAEPVSNGDHSVTSDDATTVADAPPSAESVTLPDLSHIQPGLRHLAVRIDSLVPDPANARTHDDRNILAIMASLNRFGQDQALVVQLPDRIVRKGNGRLEAARRLGWEWIAALPIEEGEMEAVARAIADNRTAELAGWDQATLAKLLAAMKADPIVEDLGFTAQEMEAILPMMAEAPNTDGTDVVPAAAGEECEYDDEPEDDFDLLFKSPYPWFGGKSRVAGKVWKHFGQVACYVEPFFGSGAVFLNRPLPFEGVETINDFDGMVCNFWRAVQAAPDEVAKWADWPVNESDLHARHLWLVERKAALQARLEGDPDYFDAKVAGWWCWGMSLWIGSGFCSGNGPWGVEEAEDGSRQLVHLSGAGQGVSRKHVHLGDAGRGVNRKRVHLGNAGQEEDAGKPGCGERGLLAWMQALAERLRRVRVCCGDWTRVCGGNSGDALKHFFACGTPCGVFLDPPYKLNLANGSTNRESVYNTDGAATDDVAEQVRQWCVAHGDDPRLRICLCGYDGEHAMPPSWKVVAWKAAGGMTRVGSTPNANPARERLWFSPHCLNESPRTPE